MFKPETRRPKADRNPKVQAQKDSFWRVVTPSLRIGLRISAFGPHSSSRSAFTLIELILVMAILTMAVSLTAPSLANFFRGRTLDSEARRLLALTRSGQNRAVSEGIPMDLWVDTSAAKVGLDAEPSFETSDPKEVQFQLDSGVQIEVLKQAASNSFGTNMTRLQHVSTASVAPVKLTHPGLPTIRFLPDGSLGENGPQGLRLTSRDGSSLVVALSRDRLSYEIQRTEK
jgi:prepilin-type N-terminal cleavage/methylation domain-containing protein